MKARTLFSTLALWFLATILGLAQNPHLGTWKLNTDKSQMPPGFVKNFTVVYEAVGGKIKVTANGTDNDGKSLHTEWIGKFDGKDYPLTGDPTADTRAYSMQRDGTLNLTNKKNGQVITSGTISVSPDGKTRVGHLTGTDSAGRKATSTAVYEKQ